MIEYILLPLLDDGEEKLDIPELGLSIECGLGGNCERNLYKREGERGGREREGERGERYNIITTSTNHNNYHIMFTQITLKKLENKVHTNILQQQQQHII